MDNRPTIHDVARHAGVAVKTVSRVLNRERAVSDAMRSRVQASIRALDYRPNSAARVLRRKVTRSIGFVCEDIAEPVQAQLARAVEAVASDHDCALTVSLTHHDPAREQAAIESLMSRQVDGLLLWPTGTPSRYLQRLVENVPIVCVDRPIYEIETDTVFCDNRLGAEMAVALLSRRDHRRIAFVGDPPELFTQIERVAGYRHALADHGLDWDPDIVFQRQQEPAALRRQVAYWRASPAPPSAIFAASSVSATTLVRALPADDPIDVVAFDDFPLADTVRGGISALNQDVETVGRAAAEMLFRRLTGGSTIGEDRGCSHLRVSPTLIDRGP